MDFETAFGTHYAPLFRYLHRLTGDADRAADIAQESFVRLLGRTLPADKVRSWLYTVATNLVRDDARARDRRHRLLAREDLRPDPAPRPDEGMERTERIAAVRAVLGEMPVRDRRLLLLREEGFRYAEIAAIVGVPETSVGKMLARALTRFERAYAAAPRAQPAGGASGGPKDGAAMRRSDRDGVEHDDDHGSPD